MSTKIEWTDETFNPITGCSKISEGCRNCYAERMSKRLAGRFGYPKDEPFRPTLHQDRLLQPFHWKKPRRIFVCSMGDLFHEQISFEAVAAVFGVMASNPEHTFQVLTKRPKRMLDWFELVNHMGAAPERIHYCGRWAFPSGEDGIRLMDKHAFGIADEWPLPNVHIGVTAENQEMADERIPLLLQTPAAKRFVSCEPLLGEITHIPGINQCAECGGTGYSIEAESMQRWCDDCGQVYTQPDQVIVGAETGPGKRPMGLDWARKIRDQCQAVGTPFFFKKDSLGNHELDGRVWEGIIK